MRAIAFAPILVFLLLQGCCGLLAQLPEESHPGYECMESPGCSDHVQRCFDGICTPISTCETIHWDNGSACNCTSEIGPWTREMKPSCDAETEKLDASGYECMESPGCFERVQRCSDGICTPISTCENVHWDNGSACNCTRDIGQWTIQAAASCNATR